MLLGIFSLFAGILLLRAVYIQLVEGGLYLSLAKRRTTAVLDTVGTRGSIFDRYGRPLAVTLLTRTIVIDPEEAKDASQENLRKLSQLLKIDHEQMMKRIRESDSLLVLSHHRSPEFSKMVSELNAGAFGRPESKRFYPGDIDMVAIIGRTEPHSRTPWGMEKFFDQELQASSQPTTVIRDRLGRVVDLVGGTGALSKAGTDVRLALDLGVQILGHRIMAKYLDGIEGSTGRMLIANSDTGEIVAMVSTLNGELVAEANRDLPAAFKEEFEPGLLISPFVVASGLDSQTFEGHSAFQNDNPLLALDLRKRKSGSDKVRIDSMFHPAARFSIANAAMTIPSERLGTTFDRFGFGQRTLSVDSPEEKGHFPKSERWARDEQVRLALGRSMAVTLPQLLRAYAAIDNGGHLFPLSLVALQDEVGSQGTPESEEEARIKLAKVLHPTLIAESVARAAVVKDVRKMLSAQSGTDKKTSEDFSIVDELETVRTIGGRPEMRKVGLGVGSLRLNNRKFVLALHVSLPSTQKQSASAVCSAIMGAVRSKYGQVAELPNRKEEPDAEQ